MSFRIKLVAMVGICLALVATTACKKKKPKEAAKQACNQVERVCKNGAKAVKEGGESCYQKCPEDTSWDTATVTTNSVTTATVTANDTATTTQ